MAGLLAAACGGADDTGGSGSLGWTRQIGSAGSETSYGVTTLTGGDAVVATITDGPLGGPHAGGRDVHLTRLDAGGEVVWETQLGGPSADSPLGVSAGPDDEIYVAGFTDGDLAGPNAGAADVWLARVDPGGSVVWQRQFGGPMWDRGFDVTAFAGGAYVSGYTFGDIGDAPGPGGGDVFVARFDAAGNRAWVVQFGTERTDWGQGSALAPDGGVYVTGFTEGDLAGPNAGDRDAFVARLAPDGAIAWVRQFGGAATDWTRGVDVDGDGNVYVAGLISGQPDGPGTAEDSDWLLASYTPGGDLRFVAEAGTGTPDELFEVRVRGEWIVATGSSTGTHELGGTPNRGERDGVLVRFDGEGTVVGVIGVGTPEVDDLTGLAVTADGRFVFSGHTYGDLGGTNSGDADVVVGSWSW